MQSNDSAISHKNQVLVMITKCKTEPIESYADKKGKTLIGEICLFQPQHRRTSYGTNVKNVSGLTRIQ